MVCIYGSLPVFELSLRLQLAAESVELLGVGIGSIAVKHFSPWDQMRPSRPTTHWMLPSTVRRAEGSVGGARWQHSIGLGPRRDCIQDDQHPG